MLFCVQTKNNTYIIITLVLLSPLFSYLCISTTYSPKLVKNHCIIGSFGGVFAFF